MSTAGKRKAGDAAAGAGGAAEAPPATKKKAAASAGDALVNPKRWRQLNDVPVKPGPVIYW